VTALLEQLHEGVPGSDSLVVADQGKLNGRSGPPATAATGTATVGTTAGATSSSAAVPATKDSAKGTTP
ncbi:unnamed protein product, partial [Amoebophrya sp. A25]